MLCKFWDDCHTQECEKNNYIRIAECAAITVFVFGNRRDETTGEVSLLLHFIPMRLPCGLQNILSDMCLILTLHY